MHFGVPFSPVYKSKYGLKAQNNKMIGQNEKIDLFKRYTLEFLSDGLSTGTNSLTEQTKT